MNFLKTLVRVNLMRDKFAELDMLCHPSSKLSFHYVKLLSLRFIKSGLG